MQPLPESDIVNEEPAHYGESVGDAGQEREAVMGTEEYRITGHGIIHTMGIWLATVDYTLKRTPSGAITGTVRVTNGERDLTPGSLFAEDLVLELEDGTWSAMVPSSGNSNRGFYHVKLESVPQPPPVPRTMPVEPAQ